jgi:hypothetical protein
LSVAIFLFPIVTIGAFCGLFGPNIAIICFISSLFCCFVAPFLLSKISKSIAICLAAFLLSFSLSKFYQEKANDKRKQIPQERVVYEGTLLNLQPRIKGGKVGVFQVEAIIKRQEVKQVDFVFLLFLNAGASLKKLQVSDRIRVFGRGRPFDKALLPGAFDPYLFGMARGFDGSVSISSSHFQ